jgi:hypothetical protein
MNSGAVAAAGVLAKTGEAAKSGPLGLALILVLCVACYFLFKSMSRHLKKVREQFPTEPADTERSQVNAGEVPPAPVAEEKAPPPAS